MPSVQDLQQELKQAQEIIAEQQEWINMIKQAASRLAVVAWVSGDTTLLYSDSTPLKVTTPSKLKLQSGDYVTVQSDTQQIVGKMSMPPIGQAAPLKRLFTVDNVPMAEIDYQSETHVVFAGRLQGTKAQEGDLVTLDASNMVITGMVEKPKAAANREIAPSGVTFQDIAGLSDAKRELLDAIVLPHKFPDIYKFYNKKPPKGILLFGPPGCGKTMLAKGAAAELAAVCKAKAVDNGFIYVKGPEILSMYVGQAEARVRELFTRARDYAKGAGHPALLFIDEAESILGVRGSGISSDMERTIVPAFLAEMDGLDTNGAIVLLATNRPDTLDPAVTRDGRIDRKIMVPRPNPEAVSNIFALNLRDVPVVKGEKREEMPVHAAAEVFSPKRVLFRIKLSNDTVHEIRLHHIVNGGMITSIVDQATSKALHRDLSTGKSSGVTLQDLYEAIDSAQRQNLHLNNDQVIDDYIVAHGNGAVFQQVLAA